jgi:hypothetical protein
VAKHQGGRSMPVRHGRDLARAGRAVAARLCSAPDAAGPGALLLPCYRPVQPTAPSSSIRDAVCLGDNWLPRLRPVNRRQSAGPGRAGLVRGGRLLEGAGRRDAYSGVPERNAVCWPAGPGAWLHPASTRRGTLQTGGRSPSVPLFLAVSEGLRVLSAFHVTKQVTTTMRELSWWTCGRFASRALSALPAWR